MTETAGVRLAECPRCGVEAKLRSRSFSDQATAALVAWSELSEAHVSEQLCDHCYEELREVLIDRVDELADAAAGGRDAPPAKGRERAPVTAPGKAPPAAKPAAGKPAAPAAKPVATGDQGGEKAAPARKGKGVKRAG